MAKERLSKYGEAHREKVGNATIVVRGIFRQNKGDEYHVRVLKGEGKQSDERAKGNVLWKDDFPYEGGDHKKVLRQAVKAAKDWLKSPAGKKKTKMANNRIASLTAGLRTLTAAGSFYVFRNDQNRWFKLSKSEADKIMKGKKMEYGQKGKQKVALISVVPNGYTLRDINGPSGGVGFLLWSYDLGKRTDFKRQFERMFQDEEHRDNKSRGYKMHEELLKTL